jgi:hypothetical protein
MRTINKCRELFLDGITDVMFYPKDSCVFPIPFSMAQVLYINDCKLPDEPTLRLATSGEDFVVVENLSVKVTFSKQGNGTIYTYDISANVVDGGENVREAYRSMRGKDYYVVLRKEDGSLQLCYSLPHTFGMGGTLTGSQTELARTFTATTQALSEPIPITLRE